MRRMGEMSDCKNVTINKSDTLEKRTGFVRGMNERFAGVVCGLFAYTSNCGQEFVLVADQSGISIRTPFVLPTFVVADCYPFDAFDDDDGEPLDSAKWRNANRYEQRSGSMVQVAGAAVVLEDLQAGLAACTRWFKDACSKSYETRLTFSFDPAAGPKQRILQVIKGNADLTELSAWIAVLDFKAATSYSASLYRRLSTGVIEFSGKLAFATTDSATGAMRLAYDATTRVATLGVQPSNLGAELEVASQQINAVQDADLGQISSLGLMQVEFGVVDQAAFSVAVIDGGSI